MSERQLPDIMELKDYAEKESVLRDLLWMYRYDEAIEFIKNIPEEKLRSAKQRLDEIKDRPEYREASKTLSNLRKMSSLNKKDLKEYSKAIEALNKALDGKYLEYLKLLILRNMYDIYRVLPIVRELTKDAVGKSIVFIDEGRVKSSLIVVKEGRFYELRGVLSRPVDVHDMLEKIAATLRGYSIAKDYITDASCHVYAFSPKMFIEFTVFGHRMHVKITTSDGVKTDEIKSLCENIVKSIA